MRCPVGALAILLHYMFDQGGLVSHIPTWDWEDAATWRQVIDVAISVQVFW